jgi:hypothetical protein
VLRMSIERLKADKEAARLKEDQTRLTELREFLSTSNNPRDRTRMEEISDQLQRIEGRLQQLDLIT